MPTETKDCICDCHFGGCAHCADAEHLERERDAYAKEVASVTWAHASAAQERDRLGATAARLRLAGEKLMGYGPEAGEYEGEISPGELAAWTEMGTALAADPDEWLAQQRKAAYDEGFKAGELEPAVEWLARHDVALVEPWKGWARDAMAVIDGFGGSVTLEDSLAGLLGAPAETT